MKRQLKMSSDSDTSSPSTGILRMGKCEVCNCSDAKYTCPKCEVKTCCLNCLNVHKKELNCSGIRDKTKYTPLKQMTKMDLQGDYNFLEECTRYVVARKRDRVKQFTRFNKFLPSQQFKLRNAANDRKITLRFLLPNFTRRQINTTHLDNKIKVIYWRIEWLFPNAGNFKYVDEKCNENESLVQLLQKYLIPECAEENNLPNRKTLEFYQSKGFDGLKILLKAEGVKSCKNRFYKLVAHQTLKENLCGKTIVEFPEIYICYQETADEFYDIIDSDDDVETEAKQYCQSVDDFHRTQLYEMDSKFKRETSEKTDEELKKEMKAMEIDKKFIKRRKKKEDNEQEPKNFLFADENLWNEQSSSGEETEDQQEKTNSL